MLARISALCIVAIIMATCTGKNSSKEINNQDRDSSLETTDLIEQAVNAGDFHNVVMNCVFQKVVNYENGLVDSTMVMLFTLDCFNYYSKAFGFDSTDQTELNKILGEELLQPGASMPHVDDFPLFLTKTDLEGLDGLTESDIVFLLQMKEEVNSQEGSTVIDKCKLYLDTIQSGRVLLSSEAKLYAIFALNFIIKDLELHTDLLGNREALRDSLKRKIDSSSFNKSR